MHVTSWCNIWRESGYTIYFIVMGEWTIYRLSYVLFFPVFSLAYFIYFLQPKFPLSFSSFSICNGVDGLPGIFIQTIRPQSITSELGLDVGDQLIEVNHVNFMDITKEEGRHVLYIYSCIRRFVYKPTPLN